MVRKKACINKYWKILCIQSWRIIFFNFLIISLHISVLFYQNEFHQVKYVSNCEVNRIALKKKTVD